MEVVLPDQVLESMKAGHTAFFSVEDSPVSERDINVPLQGFAEALVGMK
jgi:invasion protein IalB